MDGPLDGYVYCCRALASSTWSKGKVIMVVTHEAALPARRSPTTLWWKFWRNPEFWLLLQLGLDDTGIGRPPPPPLAIDTGGNCCWLGWTGGWFWGCCISMKGRGPNGPICRWWPIKWGWGGIMWGGPPGWKSPGGPWGNGGRKKGEGPIIWWGGPKDPGWPPGWPGGAPPAAAAAAALNPFILAAAAAKNGWCLKRWGGWNFYYHQLKSNHIIHKLHINKYLRWCGVDWGSCRYIWPSWRSLHWSEAKTRYWWVWVSGFTCVHSLSNSSTCPQIGSFHVHHWL